MKRYSIVFTSLSTTSGLSFKGFAFESLLAVPKESRCSLLRTPTFFDRCGTRAYPVSATGGGKARAPTSSARRSHNPKESLVPTRNQKSRRRCASPAFLATAFNFDTMQRYPNERCKLIFPVFISCLTIFGCLTIATFELTRTTTLFDTK